MLMSYADISMAHLTVRGETLRLPAEPNRHHHNRRERAMKLTSAQVERTLTQFQGEAIPDNHPVVPQLNSLFGEHTFFLNSKGLNIVEPTEATGAGAQSAKVVNLANWSKANPNRLEPHEPEPTDIVVTLGSKH
jgi:hypothetical protein